MKKGLKQEGHVAYRTYMPLALMLLKYCPDEEGIETKLCKAVIFLYLRWKLR